MTVLTLVLLAAIAGGVTVWWTGYGPGAYTNVPTGLAGQEQAKAVDVLTGLDLRHTVTERFDDAVPQGAVVAAVPHEGEQIKRGGVVELVVSRGVEMYTVPQDLVGATREEAATALAAVDFTVGADKRVWDDAVPADEVMATSVASGEAVPHYTEIVLTVSDGPAPVTVPQVVNAARADATTTLKGLGLKVKVKKEYSETVAEGRVMAQSLEGPSHGHDHDHRVQGAPARGGPRRPRQGHRDGPQGARGARAGPRGPVRVGRLPGARALPERGPGDQHPQGHDGLADDLLTRHAGRRAQRRSISATWNAISRLCWWLSRGSTSVS